MMEETASGHNRGHVVVFTDTWRFKDNGRKADYERACTRCGKMPTKDGHDLCIANLPDVKFACCGHGKEDGYVMLNNGWRISFDTDTPREEIINLINANQLV